MITLDQYQELQLWQVDMHTVPHLPAPDMICLDKRGIGQVNQLESTNENIRTVKICQLSRFRFFKKGSCQLLAKVCA